MNMTGHETESVYRRYASVSDADLLEAAEKRAAATVTALHEERKEWRRRPDSNRRITDLQSAPLTTWVRRRSPEGRILIPHARRHTR